MTIRIPFSGVVALVVVLGSLASAFGIAWAVVEWRAADEDDVDGLRHAQEDMSSRLQTVEGDLQMLEDDLGRLDNRVSEVQTPGPIADRDIQELYARTDYDACYTEAATALRDAEKLVDMSLQDYVSGYKTYAEYSLDYDVYDAAYRNYSAELEACWAAYLEASPYDSETSPGEWW
jgi:hypothetical protein